MNKRQAKKFGSNRFWKGHNHKHGFLGKYKRFVRKHKFSKRKKRWRTRQKWWFKQHFESCKWKVKVIRKL